MKSKKPPWGGFFDALKSRNVAKKRTRAPPLACVIASFLTVNVNKMEILAFEGVEYMQKALRGYEKVFDDKKPHFTRIFEA